MNNTAYLFVLIDTILCSYLIFKYFKIKIGVKSLILELLIFSEFILFNLSLSLTVILLTTTLYLRYVYKIKDYDAILIPLFSLTIYTGAYLIERSFTSWNVIEYTNSYERAVIQLIALIIINKIVFSKKNNLSTKAMIKISLTLISILFIIINYIKLAQHQMLSSIEIITGALASLVIIVLLFQYYLIFDDEAIIIDSLQKEHKYHKYSIANEVKLNNTYNKSNRLNHNLKYTLMNIKIMLNNGRTNQAIEYINDNLLHINNNKSNFTYNPFFDYIINEFDDQLKTRNIEFTKDIVIERNSIFDNEIYTNQISDFLNYQLDIINQYNISSYRLIVHEKGDFLVLKSFFIDIEDIELTTNYQYMYSNRTLKISYIVDKKDEV